jgi:hypothetical protein
MGEKIMIFNFMTGRGKVTEPHMDQWERQVGK